MAQSTCPHLQRPKENTDHMQAWKKRHIHSKHHSEILTTHQWSAGEVVYVEWIHLQLKVNTVSMLCAAETTKVKLTGTGCAFMMVCHVCVLLTASEWVSEWALHNPELQPDAVRSFLWSSYCGRADWMKPSMAETSSSHTPPPHGPRMNPDLEKSWRLATKRAEWLYVDNSVFQGVTKVCFNKKESHVEHIAEPLTPLELGLSVL